ncbi:MBL fold metallo-hydrolase [uncultured Corynebacterium sp.]|uniref:MBL fold metallo-hydrolase n=1 Tax=uncultured Corynebacterium sp. TaxID=159447 RepID=UPI0025E86766|nr:MBL fold metallo-hydrolase [uncultured Corynebacterium sp.]
MSAHDVTINDDYTGDLSRHEVHRVRAGAIDVYKTSVGEMDNNCYLLVDSRAPEQSLLIDACDEADHLKKLVDAAGARVATIVTTHSHGDHVGALAELVSDWDAEHVASTLDAPDIEVGVDRRLDQGDVVTFGDGAMLVSFILRGHTRGGVGLGLDSGEEHNRDAGDGEGSGTDGAEGTDGTNGTAVNADDSPIHLFVGDSLFPGGVGKTTTPEAFGQLLADVEERIFDAYPDDAVVHPGHGSDTTVGAEQPHLEEWRNRGW